MEKESAQIKFLIGIALILAALVIGYNAFYIPDAVPFAQISTDGSAPVPSESSEVGEEFPSIGPVQKSWIRYRASALPWLRQFWNTGKNMGDFPL